LSVLTGQAAPFSNSSMQLSGEHALVPMNETPVLLKPVRTLHAVSLEGQDPRNLLPNSIDVLYAWIRQQSLGDA
jgi:hypothetical protein